MKRLFLGTSAALVCAGFGLLFVGAVVHLLAASAEGATFLEVGLALVAGAVGAGFVGHALPEEL